MNIFKKLNTYGELEEEVKFYSRENFLKENRLRKLRSENLKLEARVNELEQENKNLKEQLEQKKGEKDGRKTTRAKHNSGNKSSSRTRSK